MLLPKGFSIRFCYSHSPIFNEIPKSWRFRDEVINNLQKVAWNKASKPLKNLIVWSLMLSQTTQAYGGVQYICFENP